MLDKFIFYFLNIFQYIILLKSPSISDALVLKNLYWWGSKGTFAVANIAATTHTALVHLI